MQDKVKAAVLAGKVLPQMTFAQKVWAVCTRIPQGKVATYGQLAKWLGQPQAARAVGTALHINPWAPAVPCHRVVGANGALTGYAGGVDKKRRMLQAEGVTFAGVRVDVRQCGMA